jgi:hypothetical protein
MHTSMTMAAAADGMTAVVSTDTAVVGRIVDFDSAGVGVGIAAVAGTGDTQTVAVDTVDPAHEGRQRNMRRWSHDAHWR